METRNYRNDKKMTLEEMLKPVNTDEIKEIVDKSNKITKKCNEKDNVVNTIKDCINNKKKLSEYTIDEINTMIDDLIKEISYLEEKADKNESDEISFEKIKDINQKIKENKKEIDFLLELKKFKVEKGNREFGELEDDRPTSKQKIIFANEDTTEEETKRFFENNKKAVNTILYNNKQEVDDVINKVCWFNEKNNSKIFINITSKNLELIDSETNEVVVSVSLSFIGKIINKLFK